MNPTLVEQLTALAAVGSSAVLGIGYLLSAFCLFMAWWHWRKLWMAESDDELDETENQKRDGKPIQALGEGNKPVCLLDQPIRLLPHPKRCLFLFFSNKQMKSGNVERLVGVNIIGMNRAAGDIPPQVVNDGLNLGIHKSVTMPNDPSSATAEPRV